jgi:cobalamin biosynthesis Co2+ chelatase CbiK
MPAQKYFKSLLFNLYNQYSQERKLDLPESQFYAIIFAFPSLLIVSCDGVVDESEKQYMDFIATNLAFSYTTEGLSEMQMQQLSRIYVDEFDYLLRNVDKYEYSFLNVLNAYLVVNEFDKDEVKEMIITSAEVSDGISEVEQQTMEKLSYALHLGQI